MILERLLDKSTDTTLFNLLHKAPVIAPHPAPISSAIWNDSFYKGVDEYSDGDVEEEILHYVQNPEESLETFIGDSYAKGYHLLPVRENILNWYPFQKDQIALEIVSCMIFLCSIKIFKS